MFYALLFGISSMLGMSTLSIVVAVPRSESWKGLLRRGLSEAARRAI
jgi:hypothetical protein